MSKWNTQHPKYYPAAIRRKLARAAGLTRYEGTVCVKDESHGTARLVSNGRCVGCLGVRDRVNARKKQLDIKVGHKPHDDSYTVIGYPSIPTEQFVAEFVEDNTPLKPLAKYWNRRHR